MSAAAFTRTMSSPRMLAQLSGVLKALCEANRLRILCFLMQGKRSVGDIADSVGLSQNLISHHLGVLREAGFVECHRDEEDARWVYYTVNREALTELNVLFASFFASDRVRPWCPDCCVDPNCCPGCLYQDA